ncbi:hypothetical protein NA57DRAFT_51657 [Rhizodiscina lignyota]|uniref:Uncharacterized protein n=1 Tax=Rhizodiscina lignyota TaxID=1504668 RepID=A0A9P4MBP2_9PEZI|nr:hypothetical protein NA57DRAFT_51657 [Rhizodiscina lignyota]
MASTPHSSLFTYSISKPYPFRWFTPVVAIGFLVFATLFSVINFVSNGYSLTVVLVSNPNVTVTSNDWFKRWPSFLTSRTQPTCQPVSLPVGSQIFTNQTALTYTIAAVWLPDHAPSGGGTVLPSLEYHNNVLENCSVTAVEIDLSAMDRNANQFGYAEWGAVVRSFITCAVQGRNRTAMLNLTQEYDYIPTTIGFPPLNDSFLGTNFLDRDKQSKACLWWGESLLSTYYCELSWQMQLNRQNQTDTGGSAIRKGTISFTPNDKSSSDIENSGFLDIDFRFIVDEGSGLYDIIAPGNYFENKDSATVAGLVAQKAYPNIWKSADSLAKSAQSTVLVDLGQASEVPNILTNASALRDFTSGFPTSLHANMLPGPATKPYESLKDTTGPLTVTPSVISTEYICQVPQRKSAGMLIVAIFIADLVFLQALWIVFRLVVDHFFLRRIPGAGYCEGCAPQSRAKYSAVSPDTPVAYSSQIELTPLARTSTIDTRLVRKHMSEQSLLRRESSQG